MIGGPGGECSRAPCPTAVRLRAGPGRLRRTPILHRRSPAARWVFALLLLAVSPLFAAPSRAAAARPIPVVAAENFYGELAARIGGPRVQVTSVLSNPDQDPHLFEVTPSVARALAGARLVVANGAGYDPWMAKLLRATRAADRRVIVVAELLHKKPGADPHLWYDPTTMPKAGEAIAAALTAADPAHAAAYRDRLRAFRQSLRPLDARIAAMRRRHAGTAVTATEPVFGYMAAALGLVMRNQRFQLAVMNNTELGASAIAAFEDDLREHKVNALIHNTQTTDPAARRLIRLARASAVPVVGVSETEPPGRNYVDWMLDQLNALDTALSRAGP